MNNEELMRPRYKVIAIDTTESFQIGDILNHPPEWHDYIWVTPTGKCIFYPEKYPHLFKKLEWWEEREPGQMPEYVKSINGWIHKVKEHKESGCSTEDNWWIPYCNSDPASQFEYEQYINQKEKQ